MSSCPRCAELGLDLARGSPLPANKECPGFEQHAWRSGHCRNCNHTKSCLIHSSLSERQSSGSVETPLKGSSSSVPTLPASQTSQSSPSKTSDSGEQPTSAQSKSGSIKGGEKQDAKHRSADTRLSLKKLTEGDGETRKIDDDKADDDDECEDEKENKKHKSDDTADKSQDGSRKNNKKDRRQKSNADGGKLRTESGAEATRVFSAPDGLVSPREKVKDRKEHKNDPSDKRHKEEKKNNKQGKKDKEDKKKERNSTGSALLRGGITHTVREHKSRRDKGKVDISSLASPRGPQKNESGEGPRRSLSDTDLGSSMEQESNDLKELKDVAIKPMLSKKGSSRSPRPHAIAIIPSGSRVQVIVSPRANPTVHEIKLGDNNDGANFDGDESGSSDNSGRRKKHSPRYSREKDKDEDKAEKREEKRDKDKEKDRQRDGGKERDGSDRKSKKMTQPASDSDDISPKSATPKSNGSGVRASQGSGSARVTQAGVVLTSERPRRNSRSYAELTLKDDLSSKNSASSSGSDSGDEAMYKKKGKDGTGSDCLIPSCPGPNPYRTAPGFDRRHYFSVSRTAQASLSGTSIHPNTSSVAYLRSELDRLLGQAQEKEKQMIHYRSEIARLKLENDQWRNEALWLREEVQILREKLAAGDQGKGAFAALTQNRRDEERSISTKSPSRSHSRGSREPVPDGKRSQSDRSARPTGRMVELRHIETKEEREDREHQEKKERDKDKERDRERERDKDRQRDKDGAQKERDKEKDQGRELKRNRGDSSGAPGSPEIERKKSDVAEQSPPPNTINTAVSSTAAPRPSVTFNDIQISAPIRPPEPPAPEGTTPRSSLPVSSQQFERLLKSAAKRMNTTEYRKSQSLKGGEVRMLQQMEMRENVVREILTTERNYKSALSVLIDEYQTPLREAIMQYPDEWDITQDQVKSLFCQVEVVMSFTTVLLDKLEARIDGWNSATSTIGDIFMEMSAFMKVYRSYIMNYQAAHDLLKKLSKEDKKFAEFLEQANQRVNKQKQFFGYDMESFLITPVQRVPRYICLLRSLHQYTGPDHKDYPLIEEAIKRVEAVAQENNKSHAANISINKLLALQEMFNAQNITIVEPDRRYVHEGRAWIAKVVKGKVLKEDKCRYLLLFSDLLMVSKIKEKKSRRGTSGATKDAVITSSSSSAVTTPDLQFMYQMDLFGMKILTEKLELILGGNSDELQAQNAFLLMNAEMTCFVYTATSPEKQRWIELLNKTIAEYREEAKTKGQGTTGTLRNTQRNSLFKKKDARGSISGKKNKELVEKLKEEKEEITSSGSSTSSSSSAPSSSSNTKKEEEAES